MEYLNNISKPVKSSDTETASSLLMKPPPGGPKVTTKKNIEESENRKKRVVNDIVTIYSYELENVKGMKKEVKNPIWIV